jgi:hypothetical protein
MKAADVKFTYTDVTDQAAGPAGRHVNVYISGTPVAEMWSDRPGNWHATCRIADHYQPRGVHGGMTWGQVLTYVKSHVKRCHRNIREHNYSIMLAIPAKTAGAITSHSPYGECLNCGHRAPAKLETTLSARKPRNMTAVTGGVSTLHPVTAGSLTRSGHTRLSRAARCRGQGSSLGLSCRWRPGFVEWVRHPGTGRGLGGGRRPPQGLTA